jgi:hypothetical protein
MVQKVPPLLDMMSAQSYPFRRVSWSSSILLFKDRLAFAEFGSMTQTYA